MGPYWILSLAACLIVLWIGCSFFVFRDHGREKEAERLAEVERKKGQLPTASRYKAKPRR